MEIVLSPMTKPRLVKHNRKYKERNSNNLIAEQLLDRWNIPRRDSIIERRERILAN